MRIIGGKFRGHVLRDLNHHHKLIRPTSDKIRESIFDLIEHKWPGKINHETRVLDLFAGTGALGFEALSRGSSFSLFVDNDIRSCDLLRCNIEILKVDRISKVLSRDATQLGNLCNMKKFDLVFVDPPYAQTKKIVPSTVKRLRHGQWMSDCALLIVEGKPCDLPQLLSGFEQLESRTYRKTKIGCFIYRMDK
ncbi:16S rRNA (guanine(966)-N(2))-methyltransferase RsmD [Candidatus Endowatersipora endosymbiont of Watersipora subatra]|uniref:16S rRNA (guanine(966)-N(2))-methyltransferase RsmD n=1 Tax=Candidatus Endowatersipora endosymbiont of Watersipora subatra TaxID=3077946 RepID=UPI00312C9BF7